MGDFDIKEDLNDVMAIFPKLELVKSSLIGEIDIYDDENVYYDSFNININIPEKYPYEFPVLHEISNKIPRIIDRHISEEGKCCVCVTQEEDIRSKRGIKIKDFMFEYVIPFLANQIYFEGNKKWANGEYKHGLAGIFQYYYELFETRNIELILKGLKTYLDKSLKPYEKCFCGSGKKLKKCHQRFFFELEKMSNKRINDDYFYFSIVYFKICFAKFNR